MHNTHSVFHFVGLSVLTGADGSLGRNTLYVHVSSHLFWPSLSLLLTSLLLLCPLFLFLLLLLFSLLTFSAPLPILHFSLSLLLSAFQPPIFSGLFSSSPLLLFAVLLCELAFLWLIGFALQTQFPILPSNKKQWGPFESSTWWAGSAGQPVRARALMTWSWFCWDKLFGHFRRPLRSPWRGALQKSTPTNVRNSFARYKRWFLQNQEIIGVRKFATLARTTADYDRIQKN